MVRVLVGALLGTAGGVIASVLILLGLLLMGNPASLGTTLLVVGGSLLGGMLIGAGAGFFWTRRLPPMLPKYREEHLRLRKLVKQIQANLEKIMGLKTSLHELEAILQKDAELRARATRLRQQIWHEARRRLTWMDHLSAGLDLFRESASLESSSITDWTWIAYRRKLYRELHSLERQLKRNRDPQLEEALARTYRQKAREVASFEQLERTLKTIENEMTLIASGLDSLMIETTRLSTTPLHPSPSIDALLQPLREQLEAYERAVAEVHRLSTHTLETEDLQLKS